MTRETVKIRHVTVRLDGKLDALKDVTVDLPQGKIVGVIGPSGAGKTTLMRSIVGRQRLTSGSISVFGIPAGASKLRTQLSYMTQEVSVYPDLTVQENLRYFAIMFGVGRKQLKPLVADLLKAVNMTPQAKQIVGSLSSGQKQRVSLAIALIGYPRLMVLDEPTVGLDPLLREQLWGLFRQLAAKGATLIISSHVMDEAERCDSLVLLREGTVVAHGTPKELCQQTGTQSVEQSFLKLAGEHTA